MDVAAETLSRLNKLALGSRLAFRLTPEGGLTLGPAKQGSPADAAGGLLILDPLGRPVLVSPREPAELLAALAGWVRERLDAEPGLARLVGARAARRAAAADVRLDALDLVAAPELWAFAAETGPADAAAVLEDAQVGEQLWYWLRDTGSSGDVPLVLSRSDADPLMERLNQRVEGLGQAPGATSSGVASLSEDGVVQFRGPNLRRGMLEALARWVGVWVEAHPPLARLAKAELARIEGGSRVAEVLAAPELWDGIRPPPPPGSLAEAAHMLKKMPAGKEAWFWMSPGAGAGPHLSLRRAKREQPDPGFARWLSALERRFAFGAGAVRGRVLRQASGALLFALTVDAIDEWRRIAAALADAHPRLAPLRGARCVVLDGESVVAAATPDGPVRRPRS